MLLKYFVIFVKHFIFLSAGEHQSRQGARLRKFVDDRPNIFVGIKECLQATAFIRVLLILSLFVLSIGKSLSGPIDDISIGVADSTAAAANFSG